jgi:hypothetical protein
VRRVGDPVRAERAAVDAAAASVARDMDVAQPCADGGKGGQWRHLVAVFGRLVAQGLLGLDEAEGALKARAGPGLAELEAPARMGREIRLAWALRDSVREWEMARSRTRFGIRRALGPMLAERAVSAVLLAAARATNEAAGGPLRDAEVVAEVRREVYWASRRTARDARPRA